MPRRIPAHPASCELRIERFWNGAPCADPRLHGRVMLSARDEGLWVAGALPDPSPARIPDAPRGRRVADLWRYDVVECFLVGAGGAYLEVELGAGGHFLVLSFRAPRVQSDAHATFAPRVDHGAGADGWRTALVVPWVLVPQGLRALNAFVAARGQHLAHAPLPGAAPDFHQPGAYPAACLAADAGRLRET